MFLRCGRVGPKRYGGAGLVSAPPCSLALAVRQRQLAPYEMGPSSDTKKPNSIRNRIIEVIAFAHKRTRTQALNQSREA